MYFALDCKLSEGSLSSYLRFLRISPRFPRVSLRFLGVPPGFLLKPSPVAVKKNVLSFLVGRPPVPRRDGEYGFVRLAWGVTGDFWGCQGVLVGWVGGIPYRLSSNIQLW